MDLSNLLNGMGGANPMQLMGLISELGPKIPFFLEKLNVLLETKEKEAHLKSDELLFHSVTKNSAGALFLFGFVMKQRPENKEMYVVRTSYKLSLNEQLEKIKSFLPPTE